MSTNAARITRHNTKIWCYTSMSSICILNTKRWEVLTSLRETWKGFCHFSSETVTNIFQIQTLEVHHVHRGYTGVPRKLKAMWSSWAPSWASCPPGRNSAESSLKVLHTLRSSTWCRWTACFHLCRASRYNTSKHLRGRRTATWTSSDRPSSWDRVSVVSDSMLMVTRRSPQSQESSRWGSMAEPRWGW